MPEEITLSTEVKNHLDAIRTDALAAIELSKKELTKKYDEAVAAGAPAADVQKELERAHKRLDNMQQELSRPAGSPNTESQKTLGERVLSNPDVVSFLKRPWHKGYAPMELEEKSFFPESFKTTITSSAVGSSTPGILVPERMPGIVMPGIRKRRVRDLMRRSATTSNAIEYVKENAFTNTASPVAETISKPESGLTFTIASAPVRTIATWIPAARQIIDDFAQLQSYIDQRLLIGLMDVEDFEIVAGDGTGQHLSGLATQAGAYDAARNQTADTDIDQISHAISQIEDVNIYPDGIIMHPHDWRNMQLVKTEEGGANKGMYLMGGPAGNADQMLWGLPVATTTAVGRGTFYVGAFQQYCMLFDRMAARIDISTEHADYFVRNLIAIRAEERLAFILQRNDAVLYGTFVVIH